MCLWLPRLCSCPGPTVFLIISEMHLPDTAPNLPATRELALNTALAAFA